MAIDGFVDFRAAHLDSKSTNVRPWLAGVSCLLEEIPN